MHDLRSSKKAASPLTAALRAVSPELYFAAALIAALAAFTYALTVLSPDWIMPIVATVFLGSAVLVALFAREQPKLRTDRISHRDVAGALVLIGICAAAGIDGDQMLRVLNID